MYTLIRAYQRHKVVKNKWSVIESLTQLLATDVEQITSLFGPVQLVLVHNSQPDTKLRYDFTTNRKEFRGAPGSTLESWLTQVANFNLSSVPYAGILEGKVYYADAFEAGFKAETTIPAGFPNNTHADEVRSDVLLTVPSHLTPDMVKNNCLFTVAGYLHKPYATVNGVYLTDAGTTLNRSNMNTCGVLSFSAVGGVKAISITPEMLSGLPDYNERRRTLNKPTYVKIPDYDPEKQTAILVLMGVMIPMGKTFREVGDGLFEINLVQYGYMLQWMRAERILGFKDIKKKIEQDRDKPTQLSMFDVASRVFIEGILTCSQSFIAVINSPGVYCQKNQLETTQNSMAFISRTPPDVPVVDGEGVLMDYLISKDTDVWVIDTPPSDQINRRILSSGYEKGDAVDSLPDHINQRKRNRAYGLHIASQTFK